MKVKHTVPKNGLRKVNANIAWLAIVTRMDTKQHIRLRPSLSTTIPNRGEETAEIVYTILFTVLASSGVMLNFLMKNTLEGQKIPQLQHCFWVLNIPWMNFINLLSKSNKWEYSNIISHTRDSYHPKA